MLGSVVVPTDFSEGSQRALERALRLPLAPKAKLTVLHVVPDDIPGKLRGQAIAEAERSIEKLIARVHALALERGVSPRQFVADVVEGKAATQILKRAHSAEADLVCIGRHGRRPVADLFMGSTARRVVKQGDVPVLLVQRPSQEPWRHALVAVDLTAASPKVLRAAEPLVADVEQVELFHASAVPFEDYVAMTGELTSNYRESFRKEALKQLKALASKWPVKAELRVATGDARILVLDEARERETALLVLGTHGVKGLKRVLMGSVAEWVMNHAACDVLVTHV